MPEEVLTQPAPRRKGRWLLFLMLALLFIAVLAGSGVVSWLAWYERLCLSDIKAVLTGVTPPAGTNASTIPALGAQPLAPPSVQNPGMVESRVAALEQRLDRLDAQANATESKTARAEALLVAFATRRAIERGAPLGYLENQLRLRFGEALPDATATVVAFGKDPVTLSQLAARLQAVAPILTISPSSANMWDRVQSEFSGLFVLHHQTRFSVSPEARLNHALLALREGRTNDAIGDVQRLPNANAAQGWVQAASRYMQAQQALDQLETVALLEPSALKDGAGHPVPLPAGPSKQPITPVPSVPSAPLAPAKP